MKLLPELSGFRQSGEKIYGGGVFVCAKCHAKRTIKPGKYLPKCSRCKEYGYWYQVI